MLTEPLATSLLLAIIGALLAISVLFSRAAERFGVPVALLFLLLGMAAGSEGIGGIAFDDAGFAFRLGTVALVLILFDGGLNTPLRAARTAVKPAAVLATVGVVLTAGMVAAAAGLAGVPWSAALVLGAVVSSTDAAAVFAVLRASNLHLRRRVALTLEMESGLNDPMAVLLTMLLTTNLVSPEATTAAHVAVEALSQVVFGTAAGLAAGFGGRVLLTRFRLPAAGLYPALTVALAFLAFGVAGALRGSGFLAVYIAGVILGDGPLPSRTGILRVHDAVAWLGQIAMFLVLGLLVFPSELGEVWELGLGLALLLACVIRPAAVALCLAPFRYTPREVGYIGWVGLRGAVPIVLAMFPVMADAPGATHIFNLVFFIVVATALVPGGTVGWVARRLRLETPEPPAPRAVLAIESLQPMRGDLVSFYVTAELAVAGVPPSDLPFPDNAAIVMVVRGDELMAPNAAVALRPGDHVYVLAPRDELPLIRLLFGRPEEE